MNQSYKICLVGLGSIGTRHIRNIAKIMNERGQHYTIDLVRSGRGKALDSEIAAMVNQVYEYADELADDYDIIFVTNPTNLHYQTIKQYVGKTAHMFIEKPVFDTADVSLAELNLKAGRVYYISCPIRYTQVIDYLKNHLDLSQVYSARVICSSYLPEWRANQDYRQTYSAHKNQGGGVSLDLIHEWDYLCYLFGQPEYVLNIQGKFSDLEIDSDDLSLYLARCANMAIEVHLDYFGRKTMREIQVITKEDTIIGDITNSEVRYLKSGQVISFREQRDDFQLKELAHFFDIVDGRTVNDNDIYTAYNTLKIAVGGVCQ
jgi:predicted dehydrogenase